MSENVENSHILPYIQTYNPTFLYFLLLKIFGFCNT